MWILAFDIINRTSPASLPSPIMATSQKKWKYGCDNIDTLHTFLVSLDSPSHVGPVAVVNKVSANYRHAMPHKHSMRPPTPPLDSFFFDDFKLDSEGFNDIFEGLQTQPVTIDFAKDLVIL